MKQNSVSWTSLTNDPLGSTVSAQCYPHYSRIPLHPLCLYQVPPCFRSPPDWNYLCGHPPRRFCAVDCFSFASPQSRNLFFLCCPSTLYSCPVWAGSPFRITPLEWATATFPTLLSQGAASNHLSPVASAESAGPDAAHCYILIQLPRQFHLHLDHRSHRESFRRAPGYL